MMAERAEDQAVLEARAQLDKLALEYEQLLWELDTARAGVKACEDEKLRLKEQIAPLLLTAGGKHTLDGVITLSIGKKEWWNVIAERLDDAIDWMYANEPALLQVGWQRLRSWCKERAERNEQLPTFIESGEDIEVRHKRA